jgi:cell wall-associated NlpC family hydrolase
MMKKQLRLLLSTMVLGSTLLGGQALAAETKEAKVLQSVNFRDKPSLSGNRTHYLKKGEKISVITKVNSYWFKAKDRHGHVGYVTTSEKYVKLNTTNNVQTISKTRQNVINAGKKYLGTPYEFGSSRRNTKTFDCSDFVRQAFIDGAGITLPSNSRTQAAYVKKIGKTSTDWRQLKPGDIMFFMSYKGSSKSDYYGINNSKQRITHNGIYLGNGKILHTYSKKSGGVRIDSIKGKHWEYRFIFGGSALK